MLPARAIVEQLFVEDARYVDPMVDVAEVDGDGRLTQVLGFLDKVPA